MDSRSRFTLVLGDGLPTSQESYAGGHGVDPGLSLAQYLEPICKPGGIVTPTDEYMQILREICKRHEALLISIVPRPVRMLSRIAAAGSFGSHGAAVSQSFVEVKRGEK